MSRRYRTKLKILRDFLLAVSKEHKKTRIMYAADMNPLTFKKYLENYITQGFIRCKDNEYFITEKGIKTLNMCENVLGKIEEIEALVKEAPESGLDLVSIILERAQSETRARRP